MRVGEVMLMQHFARCFGGSNNCNWREEYERCSEFVHENRFICSSKNDTANISFYLILASVCLV